MNPEFITAFVNSTINTLSTTASIYPKSGTSYLKNERQPQGSDVSGVIGVTGDLEGWIGVSFPEAVVFKIVINMTGEEKKDIDADVQDAVGEIVNMIAGGAKADISRHGVAFKIAIPTVISGKNHVLDRGRGASCVVMPFHTEYGDFVLEICLKS